MPIDAVEEKKLLDLLSHLEQGNMDRGMVSKAAGVGRVRGEEAGRGGPLPE